jgi:ABC-type phosphonate transport system ATPase subunit
MKKLLLFSAIVVLSVSQLTAQNTAVSKVDKLVYPGVVFGSVVNSGSCYNMTPQSFSVSIDSGVRYCVANKYFFSDGFREKFMIQYFRVRNRILDHLLA